jgi:flagellar M-ring protein FliF
MAGFKDIVEQVKVITQSLSFVQKIIAGSVIAVVLLGMLSLTLMSGSPEMKVLYANLSSDDASSIVARLKEQRIPYELTANGTAIMVDGGNVLETRLSLAGDGLPRGGGVGFEIFDKTNLGTTDFVQRLNYQRALQGELARTISSFEKVRSARVHVAQPKESVFVEEAKPPTASISVTLNGRGALSKNEIKAIINLVGSAVTGLTEENITLVDTAGHLLFRKEGDSDSLMSATQLEYQRKIETSMRRKLETMFEEVVGINKVIARVSADVDFNHVDISEEAYDPEVQIVRSEQILAENDGAGAPQEGIPGVKGQLATFTGSGGAGEETAGFSRRNVTKNYEISRTTTRTQKAVGVVRKLSVAIMVDGNYKDTEKDGVVSKEYVPRSEEEIAAFLVMARNAVGVDIDRGDTVEVKSMPFYLSQYMEPKEDVFAKYKGLVSQLALPLVLLMVAAGFVMFVVKPFFRLMSQQQVAAQRAAEQAEHELNREDVEDEDFSLTPLGMSDKERIYKLAQSDPDRAADLVRRWLREEM